MVVLLGVMWEGERLGLWVGWLVVVPLWGLLWPCLLGSAALGWIGQVAHWDPVPRHTPMQHGDDSCLVVDWECCRLRPGPMMVGGWVPVGSMMLCWPGAP